jgi:hypothetical protein
MTRIRKSELTRQAFLAREVKSGSGAPVDDVLSSSVMDVSGKKEVFVEKFRKVGRVRNPWQP